MNIVCYSEIFEEKDTIIIYHDDDNASPRSEVKNGLSLHVLFEIYLERNMILPGCESGNNYLKIVI